MVDEAVGRSMSGLLLAEFDGLEVKDNRHVLILIATGLEKESINPMVLEAMLGELQEFLDDRSERKMDNSNPDALKILHHCLGYFGAAMDQQKSEIRDYIKEMEQQ
ncbi:MAG: hypothetical protein OXG15_07065 [Gammaproteobacteria bacterium]|nr:hypothetical protein [Gammaproteobacteria bacterium]